MTSPVDTENSLTKPPDHLPRFLWLGLLPILLLIFTAVFLHNHWSAIPQQVPVHIGMDGVDRWADRSVRSVYGPLVFGVELCTWFLLVAVCSWFAAPNSFVQAGLPGMFLAVEGTVALLFSALAIQPVLKLNPLIIVGIVVAIPVTLLMVMLMKTDQGSGPNQNKASEYWKAGFVYYNPHYPDLLVAKRLGMGYTFNFANPRAWVLMLLLAFIVITAPFLFA